MRTENAYINTGFDARLMSNAINGRTCDDILSLVENAANEGEYSIIVDAEMLTKNKIQYLKNVGFEVIAYPQSTVPIKEYKIDWA